MKVFISADIEGITGVTNWDETNIDHAAAKLFMLRMSREVAATCEGALAVGATQITVRDAHDSARNIDANLLPLGVELVRGWSGSPMKMMESLDESFDAVIFIGYHSAAHSGGSPLAHTFSSSRYHKVTLNGEIASEFTFNTYLARSHGVPVVMLSGDDELCKAAKLFDPAIETVAVQRGIGNATISLHPQKSISKIKKHVKLALSRSKEDYMLFLPNHFRLELTYKQIADYYKASFYPDAKVIDERTIAFESNNFYDIARAMCFI